jgi:hypothetical protein
MKMAVHMHGSSSTAMLQQRFSGDSTDSRYADEDSGEFMCECNTWEHTGGYIKITCPFIS